MPHYEVRISQDRNIHRELVLIVEAQDVKTAQKALQDRFDQDNITLGDLRTYADKDEWEEIEAGYFDIVSMKLIPEPDDPNQTILFP